MVEVVECRDVVVHSESVREKGEVVDAAYTGSRCILRDVVAKEERSIRSKRTGVGIIKSYSARPRQRQR